MTTFEKKKRRFKGIVCPYCKVRLDREPAFCPNCGKVLGGL